VSDLETSRLRLEPLSAEHAESLYAVYREEGVRRFLLTRPSDRADFDRIFDRALSFARSHGMWAAVDQASGAVIGRIGFFAFGTSARPELAFLLSERFWGRGLATEACFAVLEHAVARQPWDDFVALVHRSNLAAIRVLAKLGFELEREVDGLAAPALLYAAKRGQFGVAASYDRVADKWCKERHIGPTSSRLLEFVARLTARLAAGARVLDVGSGCGHPVAAELVERGFDVTGLDASARMVELARRNVSGARFVHADMRSADPGRGFDALVAWDSIFHLPREQHADVFARLARWLRPGGRALLSLGGSSNAGFTSSMMGETFFYSGYDPHNALQTIERAGFAIEHWEVDDPSSRGHIAVIASRRSN
jgi:RimJ/RimL family protein N-acetyltransferase/precorrin-6B methylase 2